MINQILVGSLLSLPIISNALPVKKGEHFRMKQEGEYIVQTFKHQKIKHQILKEIGNDLYLIKSRGEKSLSSYQKVYPNYAYYGEYKETNKPNDIDFEKQFHHSLINTTEAWNTTMGSEEIIVAVTDNEFQIDHEDLKTAWWTNKNEIPDNGIDDDGNGYIDDVYGWDFIEGDNDVDSKTESTHGTHVAGIIAASANNELGGVGIAPGVKVMPLRWYGDGGTWTTAVILETYSYAMNMGAKIINTSYNIDGLVNDEAYLDMIKTLTKEGILVFNSAGNSSTKNPPRQAIEELILVCSVKSKSSWRANKKSSFSNYGTGIDICAPGDPIYAPVQNNYGENQNRYGELQGTSMASPAAAAVAALIWSAHPNYSANEVREKLLKTADDLDSRNFWYRGMLGAGTVNAAKAVK